MSSFCVYAVVLWLVGLASLGQGQTLYSNDEAREVSQMQALLRAVKRLEQENRVLKSKWKENKPLKLFLKQIKGHQRSEKLVLLYSNEVYKFLRSFHHE